MKDFFQTILGEVKSGRMQKEEALLRIRQIQAQMASDGTMHSRAGNTEGVLADTGVLMLELHGKSKLRSKKRLFMNVASTWWCFVNWIISQSEVLKRS